MIAQRALISEPYRAMQKALHAEPRGYGGKGNKWASAVAEMVTDLGASSVLDYGCGQGSLVRALAVLLPTSVRLSEYDPAIVGKDGRPDFADLVVCTDVLEHVEPALLDGVLQHLRQLARVAVFAVIATRPSSKTLPDGRNAHLIIEQADWWKERVMTAGFGVEPGPPSPLDKPSREWVAVLRP